MKHLFRKLSAFIMMLMCVSATVQAEIVHHTVCDPTFSTRGFNTECWENTETNKFYYDANCTRELTGDFLAQAVSYAKMPTSPITSIGGVSDFAGLHENHTLCGYNFNWAAVDHFQGDKRFTSTVEFKVKEDNAANARLVWGIYQHPNATRGKLTVNIYVNDEMVYHNIRDWRNTLNVENLPNVTKGDNVRFAVEPEFSTINYQFSSDIAVSLEYTFDCHHEFPAGSNTCSKCGYTLNLNTEHHTVCDPTASTLGFTQECWENLDNGKFYSDAACTQELTGAELARAVVYAKLPSNPITGNSQFNVVEFDNTETWGVNLNWAAETTFSNASHTDWSVTPRYAEFTVAGDNVEDARLVWMKNQGNVVNGRYSIKIYVKDAETQVSTEVYSYTQTDNFEGVTIQNLEGLKNGDIVKFEVAQIYAASWHEAAPTFKACLEYTFGVARIIHHTPCEPTQSSRGFTVECWEDTETRKIYADANCTQELERKQVITYAPFETSPIKKMSSEFQSLGSQTDWGITFNWAARTTFVYTNQTVHQDERYVKFTVADDNAAYARLMWNKNYGDYHYGMFKVSVSVNNVKVYELDQQEQFIEGVRDVYFKKLKKGDNVTFKVSQTGRAEWANDEVVFFTACFEYMIGDEVGPEVVYDMEVPEDDPMEEPEDDPSDPSGNITGTTMVVRKKNGDVKCFDANNIAIVECTTKKPAIAKATINGNEVDVPWVQLWENGPKFAKYNVGVTDGKAESYGGYYAWGGNQHMVDDHNNGEAELSGDTDTATKLWGRNWRMPTKAELQALLANCDVAWTTVGGVNGCLFTGKAEPYKYNSVFFPAAGYCFYTGDVYTPGFCGTYWSSTPAFYLSFGSNYQDVEVENRYIGQSVRAVLAE